MIRVDVVLDKWGMGKVVKQLYTLQIANTGDSGTKSKGNYHVSLLDSRGRCFRQAEIKDWSRLSIPAWRLIAKAFEELDVHRY